MGPPGDGPPHYDRVPGKVSRVRPWTLHDALDGVFFLVGALLTIWLGWILLVRDLTLGWGTIVYLVVFWLLLAYVALPRLQEILAHVYVPDYFIGRTLTGIGVLGDPVNLALDGTEADIHLAMTRAGWTRADDVTLRSSWGIIVSAVFKRSYPAAPVSPLLLFGRREAFAYEREVDGNASQRHHVRFWPVPDGWMLPGGRRVGWLAAATYDRAVGLSLFTLQVTHKVDADIDVERDYVVASVRYANPEVRLDLIENYSTAFTTRNGGGDVVETDGDLPVLDVGPLDAPAVASTPPPAGDLASRRLPPPALLIGGVLSIAKAVLTLVALPLAVLDGVPALQQATMLGSALLIALLWALTLSRHRWARTLLMTVCAYEGIAQLAGLARQSHPSPVVLATASISVLILIIVSSADARRWVAKA